MSRKSIAVIAGTGLLLTSVLALWSEMSLHHAVLMAAVAAGGAAVAGLIGAVLMILFRNRSFGAQATVATITPVVAIAVGAVLAAEASSMYLSPDDLPTLGVVIAAALTVALLVCLALARRVSTATQTLEAAARRIGGGDLTTRVDTPSTREFALLARELDQMSRRLEEARARERQIDASRRELVAWVSHDLRTPLAGIRAMAEALEDGVAGDPETVERYHRGMRVESERLAHLVDELFELSVIHAGTLEVKRERVSLGDLVSDAIAGATAAAEARGVRLEGKLSGAIPELHVSASQITRVLTNLLENAVRLTPRGGCVSVEAGVEDMKAYVTVADECGGIPDGDIDRVFDLAFRVERARTPGDGGGAGLGLAIARGLVQAHGGDIAVRNHGAGCVFRVQLPIRPTIVESRRSGNGLRASEGNGRAGEGQLESAVGQAVRSAGPAAN